MNNNALSQLQMVRNNQNMMNNQTVKNTFDLLDRKDHNGLVELYKQTCQTMGIQPNPEYLK